MKGLGESFVSAGYGNSKRHNNYGKRAMAFEGLKSPLGN